MNKKIVFLPYDFDTAIGINNEGSLVFSYNLEDIDQTVRAALRFVPVETVDQVFVEALCPEAEPAREEVANHVAAFAPMGRENGSGDTALRQ